MIEGSHHEAILLAAKKLIEGKVPESKVISVADNGSIDFTWRDMYFVMHINGRVSNNFAGMFHSNNESFLMEVILNENSIKKDKG